MYMETGKGGRRAGEGAWGCGLIGLTEKYGWVWGGGRGGSEVGEED